MKIAHVTATFPPYWAGTGNVAYHNARVLRDRGHDVTVFTAMPESEAPMEFPFVTRYLKAPFRLGNAPLTPSLIYNLRGFDLVHLHWPYIFGAELTSLGSKLRHTPLVATYHNDLIAPGVRGKLFDCYSITSLPLTLRLVDQIIVTSYDYAQHSRLTNLGARALEAREVPNGVDVEMFKPPGAQDHREGVPDGQPYVLFVGAMDTAHYFKGIPVLLRAMTHVPATHVVLVGDGDLRSGFQADAEILLPGRAHFVQSVPASRLVRLYQHALVTVLPSTTQVEAFGMVLLESLACGTPVVATNLPGVRSVVSDGEDGLLVQPLSVADLAGALQRIVTSSELRTHMGMRGRQKVETLYRWDLIGKRLESIYEDVLNRRGCSKGAFRQPGTGA